MVTQPFGWDNIIFLMVETTIFDGWQNNHLDGTTSCFLMVKTIKNHRTIVLRWFSKNKTFVLDHTILMVKKHTIFGCGEIISVDGQDHHFWWWKKTIFDGPNHHFWWKSPSFIFETLDTRLVQVVRMIRVLRVVRIARVGAPVFVYEPLVDGKIVGKPREYHGKSMGNHRKTMENHGKPCET